MKKVSTSDFIEKANNIHHFRYDYTKSEYQTSSTKLEIICPDHGSFWQSPSNHLQGQGCKLCRDEHFSHIYTMTKEEFIDRSNAIHHNKYDYSKVEYYRSDKKINIICPIHGEFMQTPNKHLLGHGCHHCGFLNISEANSLDLDSFIIIAHGVHDHFYDYSKSNYTSSHEYIDIICPKHGLFQQRAASHLKGNGCAICRPLFSEQEKKWLDHLKLPNDKDHRQVKLSLGQSFIIVDGFDPITNTIYEFYGDFWHGNPKTFDQLKINTVNKKYFGDLYQDTINREYLLKQAGYNLITIWENEWRKTIDTAAK